jgi:hypothetical protein
MDFFAENEVSDSGEDTIGGDSEDEGCSEGKCTHNPGESELKTGACVVYLGQGDAEMLLGYVVEVHVDEKGGPLTIM